MTTQVDPELLDYMRRSSGACRFVVTGPSASRLGPAVAAALREVGALRHPEEPENALVNYVSPIDVHDTVLQFWIDPQDVFSVYDGLAGQVLAIVVAHLDRAGVNVELSSPKGGDLDAPGEATPSRELGVDEQALLLDWWIREELAAVAVACGAAGAERLTGLPALSAPFESGTLLRVLGDVLAAMVPLLWADDGTELRLARSRRRGEDEWDVAGHRIASVVNGAFDWRTAQAGSELWREIVSAKLGRQTDDLGPVERAWRAIWAAASAADQRTGVTDALVARAEGDAELFSAIARGGLVSIASMAYRLAVYLLLLTERETGYAHGDDDASADERGRVFLADLSTSTLGRLPVALTEPL